MCIRDSSKNINGFGKKLEEFDRYISDIISALNDKDLLIITGDHGCDPTIESIKTHTREYVPLIVYNRKCANGLNLGICKPYTIIAYIISLYYNLESPLKYHKGYVPSNLAKYFSEFVI